MLDSWGAFDTAIQLSTQALAGGKTSRYKSLSQLVHENFFKFNKDWRIYKADTIQKTCKTELAFNEEKEDEDSGETIQVYPYNDFWADCQMTKYSDTMDKLEEVVSDSLVQAVEVKSDHANVELLVMIVKAEFDGEGQCCSCLQ